MKTKYQKLMVLAVIFAAAYTLTDVDADIVAYWRMESDVSEIINGSYGDVAGDLSFVDGKVGTCAIKLDGDGDYVDCGSLPTVNLDNITISAWIKTSSTGPIESIVSKDRVDKRVWQFRKDGDGRLHFIAFKTNVDFGVVIGKTFVSDNKWHHVAGTWNGSQIKIYVDGQEDGSMDYNGSLQKQGQTNHVFIGRMETRSPCYFNGLIDEVVIFDNALNKDEITWLYHSENAALLYGFLQNTEAIVKEQKPQDVIVFLEEEIGKCEKQKDENPNDIRLTYKIPGLYFLLAKAKETVGASKNDVASTYKRSLETNALSTTKQGFALLWFYKNVSTKEYEDVVRTLIKGNGVYLNGVAAAAGTMIQEQKSEEAVKFLESNIAVYEHWKEKNSSVNTAVEQESPGAYFALAKAKELTGSPKEDIADAYSDTFKSPHYSYIPEQTVALTWLLENECTSDYRSVIKSFTQDAGTEEHFGKVVDNVCRHFESEKDWAHFESFLDALFSEAKYPYDWMMFVESRLSDKTNRWAKAYFAYLDGKPELKFSRDCGLAERYTADGKFEEAIELYRDIIKRCKSDEDKVEIEFKLCKCLFDGGQYHEVVSRLESFIVNNKETHGNLVKKAMLMKGRAYVQLGELDKAIDSFLTMTMEYPQTKKAAETNFFVGYCYMLQGKFDQAKEALNLVIRDYPQSSYASKVKLCLTRIETMTEK